MLAEIILCNRLAQIHDMTRLSSIITQAVNMDEVCLFILTKYNSREHVSSDIEIRLIISSNFILNWSAANLVILNEGKFNDLVFSRAN